MYIPAYDHLGHLVNLLASIYFKSFWCSVVVTESNLALTENLSITNFKFEKNEEALSAFLFDVMEIGCHGFVVQMSNASIFFESLEKNTHKINHRYGSKRIIVVPLDRYILDKENVFKLQPVSHLPGTIYLNPVSDVSSDLESKDNENFINYEVWTSQFVGQRNNTDAILLDIWRSSSQSFVNGADLFPDKMANLQGRTVHVSTFYYKPSSMWWTDEHGQLHLEGTEMRVILQYCRQVNCTIEMVHFEEYLEWGVLFDNNTGVGMFGNVLHDRADIGFASSCVWLHEYSFLDPSSPYVRTGVTAIVPKPLLIKDFLLPYLPFTGDVWAITIVSLFLSTALLHYFVIDSIKKQKLLKSNEAKATTTADDHHSSIDQIDDTIQEENTDSIYIIKGKKRYKALVNKKAKQSTVNFIMDTFLSVLDILFLQGGGYGGGSRGLMFRNLLLFYSLFVTNAYICGLTSTLTLPRYTATIDTVAQLAESGVHWGATHDAWIFSIREAQDDKIVKVRNNFVNLPADKLQKKWDSDKFAYGIERLPNGYFAIADYVTEEAVDKRRLMEEDIYFDWNVALFRKSSAFVPHFNRLVGRLLQAGLMKAWESQVVSEQLAYKVQRGVALSRAAEPRGPAVLEFHHVQGALLLTAALLAFATVVFLFELLYQTLPPKK